MSCGAHRYHDGESSAISRGEVPVVPDSVVDMDIPSNIDFFELAAIGMVLTDREGHFELKHLPILSSSLPVMWLLAADPVRPRFGVAQIPDPPGELLLRLLPLGSATGQVVDQAGTPVAGAQLVRGSGVEGVMATEVAIRLRELGGNVPWLMTDAQGRWRTEGLVAQVEYRFSLVSPGDPSAGWFGQTMLVTSAAGETTDVGKIMLKGKPPPKD